MKNLLLGILLTVILYPAGWEIMSVQQTSMYSGADIVAKDKKGSVYCAVVPTDGSGNIELHKDSKVTTFKAK